MNPEAGVRPRVSRGVVVTAMGVTQIFAFGSTYYLPAVLAQPVATETGWPLAWVVGGLSLGLLVAGLISPLVGRFINAGRGRLVLASSSALIGCGLAAIGLAESLPAYFAGWLVVGLGMGAGLYDAAFAVLGRLYGVDARRLIAILTLFGGFASTICWPLSASLLQHLGWRGACLAYAAIQLVIALPLHLLVPRAAPHPSAPEPGAVAAVRTRPVPREHAPRFLVLAAAAALGSVVSTIVSVHLLTLLQADGLTLAAAVALGALIGPAQVGARAFEMILGHRYHPLWTLLASAVLMSAGLGLLVAGFAGAAIALTLYGAGLGIESIARGTVPLAIFDPANYAAIMGRIAMPCLIVQAASPSLGAVLIEGGGSDLTLAVLTAIAAFNALLVTTLWPLSRRPAASAAARS